MGKSNEISDHFSRDHFSCKCGDCNKQFKISLTLIGVLEHLKAKYGKKVEVLQGYLCEQRSNQLYGSAKDYHHRGKAVDIRIEGVELAELFREVESLQEVTGIGLVPQENYLHIDIRDKERLIWVRERNDKVDLTAQLRKKYQLS